MKTLTLKELGDRIKKARKELNYKNREVFAQAVGVTNYEMKKIESGEKAPPYKIIKFICDHMGITPRAFIFGDVEQNNLLFRGEAKGKKLAESDLHKLAVIKDAIETLVTFKKAHYNRFDFEGDPNPQKAAREFIEAYGLKTHDFNTWRVLVEPLARKHIYIFAVPLKSRSSVIHNSEPFFIVVNSNEPKDRWSFSVLHEIGHLVAPEEEKDDENYANVFAREVLIPEELRYILWKELGELIIERHYKKFFQRVRELNEHVSPEAVFFVLINIFYGGRYERFGQFKKFCQKQRKEESAKSVPHPVETIFYPTTVIKKLRELYDEKKITRSRLQELLLGKENLLETPCFS